ncbi:MAG: hypothetical protein HQL71_14770 [Magnetococcales bacterium]|nr:hypothetical protein [Magnetococcales bacterium]
MKEFKSSSYVQTQITVNIIFTVIIQIIPENIEHKNILEVISQKLNIIKLAVEQFFKVINIDNSRDINIMVAL